MRALIFLLFLLPTLGWADATKVIMQKTGTYSASAAGISAAATPTDICGITGATGKTIKVTKLRVSTTQNTPGINTWYLIKRSSHDVGSTFVAMTSVPHNSNAGSSGTAGADAFYFTGNPTTLGALLGYPEIFQLGGAGTALTGFTVPTEQTIVFGNYNNGEAQAIQLNSAAEELDLNFNSVAPPTGLLVNCSFTWTEE